MNHLPTTKQEYQVARLVFEITSNPDKYKEIAVYSLTEEGAEKYKAVASKFIKSNEWLLEEDEMSITIWTGAKIKFVGLGELTSVRKLEVKNMQDIGYIDEWFTA